jgi:hypothetical protein
MTLTGLYSQQNGIKRLIIMDDIIQETINTKTIDDLRVTETPKESNSPELTAEKIESCLLLLKNVVENGGFVNIAQTVGLSTSQVHEINYKRLNKISELLSQDEDEEGEIVE